MMESKSIFCKPGNNNFLLFFVFVANVRKKKNIYQFGANAKCFLQLKSDAMSKFIIFADSNVKQEVIDITDDELPLLQELPQFTFLPDAKAKKKNTYYRCELCPRKYKYRVSLMRHKAESHDLKRFGCPYCEYKCARKYYLQKHISVHLK